ncbi:MAG: ankyrin repeat domain-containing protein [Gammaproteobacteria bacterium]|nr:ankyrin repeat domain-containing protein [Gammaproteobacteria bacterium]
MGNNHFSISRVISFIIILLGITLLQGCGASMSQLTKAASSNDMVAMKKALKSDGKVNKLDDFGQNALHVAVKSQNIEMISFLLQQNADPNITTKYGEYPVVMASKTGNKKAVKLLLDAGADASQLQNNRHSPLYEAAGIGNMDIINLLLARGAKLELDGKSPLTIAAANGHAEVVQILIAKGLNIEEAGPSSLVSAAEKGHVEIVKILLAANINPNKPSKEGEFAIVSAGDQDNPEVAMLLLAAGADIHQANSTKSRALYKAATNGYAKMIDFLVAAGSEVDFYAYNGWTPLTAAANNGHADAVKSLLAAGADPDFTNSDGISAIYTAAKTKTETKEVIKYLIASGANLNKQQDKYDWTAVHVASSKAYKATLKQLLSAGADPDVEDVDGDTALHLAASEGRYTIVEVLLQYGASPNSRNAKGQTPGDKASGYRKTSATIAAYGGRTVKKKSSGSSFGKIFATVAIAGLASNANISANDTAKVMSATVNDIWIKDGKGTQLGNMYKESIQNGGARSNNPVVNEMISTRNQQTSAADIYSQEMKKYQKMIEQQRLQQQKNNPSLYQQQLNRIAQQSGSNIDRQQENSHFTVNNVSQSRISNQIEPQNRNHAITVTRSDVLPTQTRTSQNANKCSAFSPPLSTHTLPILSSNGVDHLRSDGAIPTLLRQTNEHMESTCGNKNFRVNGQIQPSWNTEIIEKRKFFNRVELTLKDGQMFSCLCTPPKSENRPGRGVVR